MQSKGLHVYRSRCSTEYCSAEEASSLLASVRGADTHNYGEEQNKYHSNVSNQNGVTCH